MTLKVLDFKGHPHQVLPCGIEPQPSEPESEILSIKLREHFRMRGPGNRHYPGRGTANIAIFSKYPDFFVFLSGYVRPILSADMSDAL